MATDNNIKYTRNNVQREKEVRRDNDKIQEVYKRKGFTTKDKLKMMTAKVKTESRKQAINELLSEKRYESKRKSKKIAREINKEMAERKRQEELMYGGGGF